MRDQKFNIKFTIYGKKMQTTLLASCEDDAKYLVRSRIKFDSIEEVNEIPTNENAMDYLNKTIFGKFK